MWMTAATFVFARRGDLLRKVFEGDPVAIGCLALGIGVVFGIPLIKNMMAKDDDVDEDERE